MDSFAVPPCESSTDSSAILTAVFVTVGAVVGLEAVVFFVACVFVRARRRRRSQLAIDQQKRTLGSNGGESVELIKKRPDEETLVGTPPATIEGDPTRPNSKEWPFVTGPQERYDVYSPRPPSAFDFLRHGRIAMDAATAADASSHDDPERQAFKPTLAVQTSGNDGPPLLASFLNSSIVRALSLSSVTGRPRKQYPRSPTSLQAYEQVRT